MTTIQELDALAPHWPALGEQPWGPLVSHAWFTAAARAFHASSRLHVITLWRDGALAAVAPLVRARHRSLQCLEVIGQKALYEPTSLVAKDAAALGELCAAIVNQGMPTVLQRLDVADPCVALLRDAASGRGELRVLARPATYFVSAPEYAVRAAPSDLRRKRRRLAEQGFHTEVKVPTLAELPKLLATFFALESSGWKGRRGSSLLARPDLRRFLSELAESSVREGTLVISLLRGPERSIAGRFGIYDGRRFFALKTGYDEQWGKYSPGLVVTADTIDFAVNGRQGGFEFLGLAEEWQKSWATGAREYCVAVFYPRTSVGMVAMALDMGVSIVHRFRAAAAIGRD